MHVLVEWPLHRQRLQQREGLVGQSVGHQGTSEVPHQPGSNRAQPVAMRRRPVLIEVLGQELTRPQGERVANVLGRTGRGSHRGRGLEVVDVDGHAALAAEDDDLVLENEVLGAHHPAGRMQRLMEVVRADRRVGLGPQLLDEHITVNPMARPERQELDDRLCLPQPPRWLRAAPSTLTVNPPRRAILTGPRASLTHACSLLAAHSARPRPAAARRTPREAMRSPSHSGSPARPGS